LRNEQNCPSFAQPLRVLDSRQHAAGGSKRANCSLRCTGWFSEGFDTRDLKEAKALLKSFAA
jgi:hypothetical protein